MKANGALQIIFAFFLGLVVVAFFGIGVNTFYPAPEQPTGEYSGGFIYERYRADYDQWALITVVILVACATVILAVSLFLPENQAVLSNGILLGGVFTLVYAVGWAFTVDNSMLRFGVIAVALVVTVVVGYLRFARRGQTQARPVVVASPDSSAQPAMSAQSAMVVQPADLEQRLAALERKLDALGRALNQ